MKIVEPINGQWGEWSSASECSATCGQGKRTRQRFCDSPAPSNGGIGCVGAAIIVEICMIKECLSEPNPYGYGAAYVQRCPVGFFTCFSGRITCIDEDFVCDCAADCDDGSDENLEYAGCNVIQCKNTAAGVEMSFTLMALLCLVQYLRARLI
ncbi:ectin-like [Mya arenaria]|uniref:ectin-like n=1 Tax=Mya arenaria TaxID=6604 RepID=UPI0022E41726|nr:ectin-like [Mya arenaria]